MNSEYGWTVFVPGNPVAQPRHRVSARGGFARTYLPKGHPVHAYKKAVHDAAVAAGLPVFSGPVDVEIAAVFALPKSWSKKKRDAMACSLHTHKPDADNIAKAVLDALSAFWTDDAQVAVLRVRKTWSMGWHPGTHIRIREAT